MRMTKVITIFKDITTDDALIEIEKSAKKYDGLYCDLSNDKERKFVKDQAEFISALLKKLDRSRIDQAKGFKIKVEAEAKYVRERLEAANKPFTSLLDEWKAERKAILDAEKAAEEKRQSVIKLALDYDEAVMMNKVFDFESKEKLANEQIELEKIKLQAVQDAKANIEREAQDKVIAANKAEEKARHDAEQAEKRIIEQGERLEREKKQAVIDAENKAKLDAELLEKQRDEAEQEKLRIAANEKRVAMAKSEDKEHRRVVNQSILKSMIDAGISKDCAMSVIRVIAANKIMGVTINY